MPYGFRVTPTYDGTDFSWLLEVVSVNGRVWGHFIHLTFHSLLQQINSLEFKHVLYGEE